MTTLRDLIQDGMIYDESPKGKIDWDTEWTKVIEVSDLLKFFENEVKREKALAIVSDDKSHYVEHRYFFKRLEKYIEELKQ